MDRTDFEQAVGKVISQVILLVQKGNKLKLDMDIGEGPEEDGIDDHGRFEKVWELD
jgi:hypothetical protein